MTPTLFRTRLNALGYTLGAFANMTGTHPVTVRAWGSERHQRGVQDFPKWVDLLLTAWEQSALPAYATPDAFD